MRITIIRTNEGEQKVLIELQKAKFSTDIMRFRWYSGEQYKKDEYPIIIIYLLGQEIDKNLPAILSINRVLQKALSPDV